MAAQHLASHDSYLGIRCMRRHDHHDRVTARDPFRRQLLDERVDAPCHLNLIHAKDCTGDTVTDPSDPIVPELVVEAYGTVTPPPEPTPDEGEKEQQS